MDDHAVEDYWPSEDLELDMESPLYISHSLWQHSATTGTVVRSLFALLTDVCADSSGNGSISCAIVDEEQECMEPLNSLDILPECLQPTERPRVCHGTADEAIIPSASIEGAHFSDVLIEADPQRNGSSSPSSVWLMANEDSMSSVDDVVEQSVDGWMADYIKDDHEVGITAMHGDVPAMSLEDIAGGVKAAGAHRTMGPHFQQIPGRDPAKTGALQAKQVLKRRATHFRRQTSTPLSMRASPWKPPSEENPKPIVYPFSLLKPCGMQGDATLKDINRRINTTIPPTTLPSVLHQGQQSGGQSSSSTFVSPISGKSVVVLTKIHTEGNGVITILRTKG